MKHYRDGSMNIQFRPICREDTAFLFDVYASTRRDELAVTGWTDFQITSFLQMQFNAQHLHYQQHYPDADFLIVSVGSLAIGRLYLGRWPEELRIIDIALLPSHRNQGIGSRIMSKILAEAEQCEKPVRLNVERFNPAMKWYGRMGFLPIGESGIYYLMERPVPMTVD